jgi:microsomal epoxide hydrolase
MNGLSNAKSHWETNFDWRQHEKRINSFANYLAQIRDDDGDEHEIHFVALFSEKHDAIPVMCIHRWPGSFLESLDMLSAFEKRYMPQELPHHIIIPSLLGYAFSSTPPLGKVSRESATIFGQGTIPEPSVSHIGQGVALVAQGVAFVYI